MCFIDISSYLLSFLQLIFISVSGIFQENHRQNGGRIRQPLRPRSPQVDLEPPSPSPELLQLPDAALGDEVVW